MTSRIRVSISKTYFLDSYGCTLNASDAEIIDQAFALSNLERVNKASDANIIIVNTCGVKVPTEQKILHVIQQYGEMADKILLITGCLPLIYRDNLDRINVLAPGFGAIVGPRNYHELPGIIEQLQAGQRNIVSIEPASLECKYDLEMARPQPHLAILPVAEGCLGACTYCCTRFARGSLDSYPAPLLETKMAKFLAEGATEVLLTAEDCSAYYDKENGIYLPKLIDMLSGLGGVYFIRVGMMNPRTVLPITNELVDAFSSPAVFKFLHVPVQSGSDRILKAMNRQYSRANFLDIVCAFRERYPTITIATDVICGYPGEMDADFDDTLALMHEVGPDVINISMYGNRPGTAASKLKPLPTEIIKERSRKLTILHREIVAASLQTMIGWEGPAIVDEINEKKQSTVARTADYRPIVLQSGPSVLGEIIQVRVTGSGPHYLIGEPVSSNGN
jgi:MiaB-like tRNA modifying enzyme